MKKITTAGLFLCMLFLFASAANAQSKQYKVSKKKCVRVEISDPGEFYSTYEFEEVEIEKLKELRIKESVIELIKKYHTEEEWPAELANFDTRINNAEKVKTYVVYLVTEIGDKYILVVPAKYNKTMGEGWAPAQDIYFIIGKTGVTPV